MDPDSELRERIMNEHDPFEVAALVGTYYHDNDRAARASRELMYLHLGMLCGCIMRLQAERER